MKIRNGFVSNSSSSSFVCIAKPGVIKKLLKNEDEITQKVVNTYLNQEYAKKIKLDTNEYELYQLVIDTEEFGSYCDLDTEQREEALDKWDKFTNKLSKMKSVVVHERDC